MKDFRKSRGGVSIDPELIRRGERQLLSEISLLEQWLKALRSTPEKSELNRDTINSYQDMLRSRQDMLAILREQAKK
tara:strand:- start:2104 stop:2334 length:231 start_codon:yes stop_codon:yes gene_type:complete